MKAMLFCMSCGPREPKQKKSGSALMSACVLALWAEQVVP